MDLAAEETECRVDDDKEERPFLTGFFRDGIRRVDLVLVGKETGDKNLETLKMNFLSNAVHMGLELEMEPGVAMKNMDLIFIKIHAPDHIIRHFGYFYNMRKFFKKSHIELMESHVKHERELIKVIRRWYPGPGNYSTIDRATIVYKVLLSVPFGDPFNFVGVNQMLERRLFLDLFPLHDGPYQLTVGQTPLELTGRQALYYRWCGWNNIFRTSPVHLLREYFGERIGFLFAFYQFYNWWLLLLSLIGTYFFADRFNYKDRNIVLNEYGDKNEFHYKKRLDNGSFLDFWYSDLPLCPRCRDFVACPFRNLSTAARELEIKVMLADPKHFYLMFVAPIWGILFCIFWRRRELYLYWIWECFEDDGKNLVRPSFRKMSKPVEVPPEAHPLIGSKERVIRPKRRVLQKIEKGKKRTWAHQRSRMACTRTVQFLVMLGASCAIMFGYFPLMRVLENSLRNKLRYVEDRIRVSSAVEQFNHFVMEVLGSIEGVFILVMEYWWFKLTRRLARYDNPRTEWLYEEHLSVNMYGGTLFINLIMVIYVGYVKGTFYRTPNTEEIWIIPLGIGMDNCGLLSCIDEAFLRFVSTFKTKTCIEDIYRRLEMSFSLRDDIQEPASESSVPIPCWEREFRLRPLTEEYFWKNINMILLQHALVSFFITTFQLSPLVAFLWNLWHLKYMAAMIVKYHRRPLLQQTWGLGGWLYILLALPYMSCFFNALYIVKHNTLMHTRFNRKYWSHQNKRRFIADYFLNFFNVSDGTGQPGVNNSEGVSKDFTLYNETFNDCVPDFCMFPAAIQPLSVKCAFLRKSNYKKSAKSVSYHEDEGSVVLSRLNRLVTFDTAKPVNKEKNLPRIAHNNRYMYMAGHYYILWHQALLLLLPMIIIVVTACLLHFLISSRSRFVAEHVYVEDAVKRYDITSDMAPRVRRDSRPSGDRQEDGSRRGTQGNPPPGDGSRRDSPPGDGPRLPTRPRRDTMGIKGHAKDDDKGDKKDGAKINDKGAAKGDDNSDAKSNERTVRINPTQ